MNECPRCETNIFPELFEQEIICTCGALLNVKWDEHELGYSATLTEIL
jgi:hypothetical protein